MGRLREVEDAGPPPVSGGAARIRRHMIAWGICQGNRTAQELYNDRCREIYAAEHRVRLTPEEDEAILERCGLLEAYFEQLEAATARAGR